MISTEKWEPFSINLILTTRHKETSNLLRLQGFLELSFTE